MNRLSRTRLSRASRAALAAVACLAAVVATAPAHAAGTITCQSLDEANVFVELTLGEAAVARPVSARIDLGDALWSTLAEDAGNTDRPARRIALAQAFVDAAAIRIDLADEPAQEVVASLRILRVEEQGEPYQIGYLRIPGRAVHPVSCTGP